MFNGDDGLVHWYLWPIFIIMLPFVLLKRLWDWMFKNAN